MSAPAVTREGLGQVLRLSESCNPGTLDLSPAQGFLFSRIDGQTPWRLLREMGGLSPDEVDGCLQSWLDGGLIEVEAKASSACERSPAREAKTSKRSAAKEAASTPVVEAPKAEIDEALIDSALDLEEEAQRRILEFEVLLDRSYYEILGVDRDADARSIKKAYFKLSKDFHPDRYFRRNIGDYAKCLDRIFKKVLEAHELLSDETTRAEIDKSLGPLPEAGAAGQESSAGGQPKQRPLTPIERLKQRMPFKISQERIAERKAKAEMFHQSAEVSARGCRFLEAASSARLAIAFDPSSAEYKRSFAEIQTKAANARVEELLARDDKSLDAEEQVAAMSLYEDTLLYRPHDPVVNDRAAQLALILTQVDKALEYAMRAVEHSPEEGDYHRTLGRVYHAQGDRGHAVREFQTALKRNPKDAESRKMLTALKARRQRAS